MGKKIIVNERVLKHILMEMTKERAIINEAISVADAYAKFYSSKLDREEYDLAVNGTTNMTPYHKALLDCMIKAKENQSFDYISLGKNCGDIWANADANIRQLLLKAVKTKELSPKDPNGFYEKTIEISQTKTATKAQVANNGLITLYEDDKVLITCTTTYSASHKFYADSHWCTASDIYGQYNGYCMFYSYAIKEESCLIQIVSKAERTCSFQMQVGKSGVGQICDYFDNSYTYEEMASTLQANVTPNIEDILFKIRTDEKINYLIEKTKVDTEEDSKYWVSKTEEKISEVIEKIDQKISLDKYDEYIKSRLSMCMNRHLLRDSSYLGDTLTSVSVYTSGSFNAPYFLLKYEIDSDEILSEEESSWLWSCRRVLSSASKASARVFLCKMTSANEIMFEVIKQLDDFYSYAESLNNVLGYCTEINGEGDVYTFISNKTGEVVFKNEYVEYYSEEYLLLGKHRGPYSVYDLKKMALVLSGITSYYLSWGTAYVSNEKIAASGNSNYKGFMQLEDAIRYYGQ